MKWFTPFMLGAPPALGRPTAADDEDAFEQWQFDLNGYLVVDQVMDAGWLAAANGVIDPYVVQPSDLPSPVPPPEWDSRPCMDAAAQDCRQATF